MNRIRPILILLAVFLVTGCFGGATTAPMTVRYYTLEYPPPLSEGKILHDAVIRWERFTAAPDFNSRDMVYRSQPFVRDTYRYYRWSTAPADMAQGLLLRDLRQAGIFRAVLSPDDQGDARYTLYGHVEEFLQRDEKGASLASVIVSITLVEARKAEPGGIILQTTYRLSEPLASRGPQEMAKGMSAAMAKLSAALLKDFSTLMQERQGK